MAGDPDTTLQPDQSEHSDNAHSDQYVVNTQGGDYAKGDIDKRQGTFVGGDQFDMSGDFREAKVYVKSTIISEEQAYNVAGLPNPYLGLGAFTYDDQGKFAGRDHEIAASVALLTAPGAQCTLLFVTGASGSGKSSFAQAGLLPALESHYRQRHFAVQHAILRPSRFPLASLIDALQQLQLPAGQLAVEALIEQPGYLAQFVQQATPAQQVNLIVLDQFEELFTQSEPAQRDSLFTIFEQLPPFATLRTHIIVTMRSDYLPELFEHKALYEIAKVSVDLRAMESDELEQAIQRPLQQESAASGKCLQPALLERLVRDAADDAASLPLLQVTLTDLWQDGSLQLSAYQGLANAIQRRADAVYIYHDYDGLKQKQRVPEEQAAILSLFLELARVPLDDKQPDARWRRPRAELTRDNPQRERLIADLATARLLHTDREAIQENGQEREVETVDIIHEALLSGWPILKQAIDSEREILRQRVRFDLAVTEWLEHKKHDDYLLAGVRLAEAEALKQRGDGVLQRDGAQSFFTRSLRRRDEERQRQVRRVRMVSAALSLLTLLALLAAGVAGWFGIQASEREADARNNAATAEAEQDRANQQARIAQASSLGARAELMRSRQGGLLQLSALLAIESMRLNPTFDTDQTIRSVLSDLPRPIGHLKHEQEVGWLTFSPDGRWIATTSKDQVVRVWPASGGEPVAKLNHDDQTKEGAWIQVAFSSDSHYLVTATRSLPGLVTDHLSRQTSIRIWNIESGHEILRLPQPDVTRDVKFSPDGTKIAAIIGKYAYIWEFPGGKLLTSFAHTEEAVGLQFSPNSRYIVTESGPESYLLGGSPPDYTTILWDINNNEKIFEKTITGAWDVQISHSGEFIAIPNAANNSVQIWNLFDGSLVKELKHSKEVLRVIFSPDDTYLVTVSGHKKNESDDHVIGVWDYHTGMSISQFVPGGWIRNTRFIPGTNILVSSNHFSGVVRFWDINKGEQIAVLEHESEVFLDFSSEGQIMATGNGDQVYLWNTFILGGEAHIIIPHKTRPLLVAFDSQDEHIITVDGNALHQWNLVNNKLQYEYSFDSPITAMSYSKEKGILAVASGNKSILLFDDRLDKPSNLVTSINAITALSFSDADYLAASGDSGVVSILSVSSNKEISRIRTGGTVRLLALSPDATSVATVEGKRVCLWKLPKGDLVRCNQEDTDISRIVFSNDSHFLAIGLSEYGSIGDLAGVWEVDTGKSTVARSQTDAIADIIFSPDNKRIALVSSASYGSGPAYNVTVWELTLDGSELTKPILRTRGRGAKFSLDGKFVLVVNGEGGTNVWDLETKQIAANYRHDGTDVDKPELVETDSIQPVEGEVARPIVLSTDGRRVATVGKDNAVRVWLWKPSDVVDETCYRLTRNLSLSEWEQYIGAEPYHRTCPNLPNGVGVDKNKGITP